MIKVHRADHVVYVAKMARVFPAQGHEIGHPVGGQPGLKYTDRNDMGQPGQEFMSLASKQAIDIPCVI